MCIYVCVFVEVQAKTADPSILDEEATQDKASFKTANQFEPSEETTPWPITKRPVQVGEETTS